MTSTIIAMFEKGQRVYTYDQYNTHALTEGEVIDVRPEVEVVNLTLDTEVYYWIKGLFGWYRESELFSSHAEAMKAMEGKG